MSVKPSNSIKICLLGASFETNNMGVSALAEASIKCILNRWPDAEIVLLDSGRDKGQYWLDINGRQVRVVSMPIRFSANIFCANHFIVLSICALLLKMQLCKWFSDWLRRKNKCVNLFLETHLVADITGGDSFSDIYGLRRFIVGFLRKWLVIWFGIKLVMLPQTYGPFKHWSVKLIARYILKRAYVIYSRDAAGVAFVRNLLGSNSSTDLVRFSPDVGFVLDGRKPDGIESSQLGEISQNGSLLVGLNISGLLFNSSRRDSNPFKLKTAYPDVVYKIIDLMMQKNLVLLLVPHVFAEPQYVESDIGACRMVYDRVVEKYPNRIFLVDGQYDHNEIKYIIGMSDFFIGSRMHSCIAAMSQFVPAVGIAYSKKFSGVFEAVGMGDLVADMRKCTDRQILQTVSQAWDKREALAAHLKTVMPKLQKMALSIFEDID